jgi:hypothetical protein
VRRTRVASQTLPSRSSGLSLGVRPAMVRLTGMPMSLMVPMGTVTVGSRGAGSRGCHSQSRPQGFGGDLASLARAFGAWGLDHAPHQRSRE